MKCSFAESPALTNSKPAKQQDEEAAEEDYPKIDSSFVAEPPVVPDEETEKATFN